MKSSFELFFKVRFLTNRSNSLSVKNPHLNINNNYNSLTLRCLPFFFLYVCSFFFHHFPSLFFCTRTTTTRSLSNTMHSKMKKTSVRDHHQFVSPFVLFLYLESYYSYFSLSLCACISCDPSRLSSLCMCVCTVIFYCAVETTSLLLLLPLLRIY